MREVEVLFLGTCACDYSPALKGEFAHAFSKDARRSSSILMDGRYLVDCGPHTLGALEILGINHNDITDLFLTHLHDDHYDEKSVRELSQNRETPLRVWVREDASISIDGVEIIKIVPFKSYIVESGVEVTSYLANHDQNAFPQHFIFKIGEKKLFYGCDGGWFLNQTFNNLREQNVDFAVFDCTTGDYEGDYRLGEHNSIPMIRLIIPSSRTIGFLKEESKIYLSHIAPSLHAPHEVTVKICKKFGVEVAYDGLRVSV